jgi:hypothetical protein
MVLSHRCSVLVLPLLVFAGWGMVGCANPGPPKSPSLRLPAYVRDLAATRRGTTVELRFTIPQSTTDKLPLKAANVKAEFCRAVDTGACVAVPELPEQSFARVANAQPGQPTLAVVHDTLPAELASGAAHVLAYRVELFGDTGRTAGFSDPAYAASGVGPSPVEGLQVQGSRLGVVLSWKPSTRQDDGTVILRREDISPNPKTAHAPHRVVPATPAAPSPGKTATAHRSSSTAAPKTPKAAKASEDNEPNVVWLTTAPQPDPLAGDSAVADPVQPARDGITLDITALADESYRYTAERRLSVLLGGRTLELRSEVSAPVEFTLHDVYPPAAPTDLSAASFDSPKPAVDLIWQPVDDPRLAGYNVYRDNGDGNKTRLNSAPVSLPAFHDDTVTAGKRYRYSVTAVDAKGNESVPVVMTIDPNAQ